MESEEDIPNFSSVSPVRYIKTSRDSFVSRRFRSLLTGHLSVEPGNSVKFI